MKTGCIITEFNPFHNGHKYIIDEIKQTHGIDCLICIMSGNFTQRGEPAIINKFERTKVALSNGIDVVVELPFVYSTAVSDIFAYGSVNILNQLNELNNIDSLFFGSESNFDFLDNVSNALISPSYEEVLSDYIVHNPNFSFAKNRELAIKKILNVEQDLEINLPNNILALEYIKHLKLSNSTVNFVPIKRIGDFNEVDISKANLYNGFKICSATSIRNCISSSNLDIIENCMPISSFEIIKQNIQNGTFVNGLSSFEKEILFTIRKSTKQNLQTIADIPKGFENVLVKEANLTNDLNSLISALTSKNIPRSRIRHILLYILFNISKDFLLQAKQVDPYIRVLGFNDTGFKYLQKLQKNLKERPHSSTVIGYSFKDVKTNLEALKKDVQGKEFLNEMLALELLSSNMYTLGYSHHSGLNSNLDLTQKVIRV